MIVRGRLITQTIHRTYIILYTYNICALQIELIYAGVQFVLANRISKKKIYYNIYVLHGIGAAAADDRCGPVKNMIYSTEFSLRALVLLLLSYIIFFNGIPVNIYVYIFFFKTIYTIIKLLFRVSLHILIINYLTSASETTTFADELSINSKLMLLYYYRERCSIIFYCSAQRNLPNDSKAISVLAFFICEYNI